MCKAFLVFFLKFFSLIVFSLYWIMAARLMPVDYSLPNNSTSSSQAGSKVKHGLIFW